MIETGETKITNLGDLAYANSIAANQIEAGILAAGVIYSGGPLERVEIELDDGDDTKRAR